MVFTLTDPRRALMSAQARKANYRFGLAEAVWILSGTDSLKDVVKYNSRLAEFSDDGRTLWGAYGPRLIGQLDHVLSTLRRDPDSRQAVITTWRPMVPALRLPTSDEWFQREGAGVVTERSYGETAPGWDGSSWRSKDVPCTVAWHFQLRDEHLDLTVLMRSNDAWLGLPYDLLSFTTVQRVVASALGAGVGVYNHVVSNLHLYDENILAAVDCYEQAYISAPILPDFGTTFGSCDAKRIADIWGSTMRGQGMMHGPGVHPYADAVAPRDATGMPELILSPEITKFVKDERRG